VICAVAPDASPHSRRKLAGAAATSPDPGSSGNLQKDHMATKDLKKKAAHGAVERALKRGDLVRQPCERCGASGAKAHHDDYSNKLEVIWLCSTHHAERHRELDPNFQCGAGHVSARLTEEQVLYIRTSNLTDGALATELGRARSTIQHARSGTRWSHLLGAAGRRISRALTEAEVRMIRASDLTAYKLSAQIGVHPKVIQKARNGTTWRHLPGARRQKQP